MFILYVLVAAGLAWWLWIIRPWLVERGRHQLARWTKSAAIGSAIIAVGTIADMKSPEPAMFFAGLFLATLFVTFLRNVKSYVAGGFQKIFGRDQDGAGYLRGAKIAVERDVAKQLRGTQSRFSVGLVPVPVELETRGFLLAGSPGAGKSQTLTHALDALRADGARAVVADASGIYTSRFYTGRDVIVNPFDERCAPWSPLAELESVADIPALAKSLVPDGEGSAGEWNSYAQTFVEAVLEHCFTAGLGNGEFFRILIVADMPELREICAGTPAQPLVAEGNERMFGSVRGIASSAAKFLQYLDPAAGATNGFSIRRHLVEEREGWIFLSYQQQHRDALKSMIACAVDVASRAVLSLPPSHDRRVIFGLDEMPLLGKVQSIVDLATNGRKHGAMIFAGLQTVAQVQAAYGRETAQTLLSCLGSWLVLRVADAETAEYMSRYLGEEEKTRIVASGGESKKFMESGSKSENWQQQILKDRVVMPSELQSLPDLRGIFNLAGPVPSAVVTLQIAAVHKQAEAFVAAPPRARVKPPFKQQQKQAGGTSRDSAAEIESLDLL